MPGSIGPACSATEDGLAVLSLALFAVIGEKEIALSPDNGRCGAGGRRRGFAKGRASLGVWEAEV